MKIGMIGVGKLGQDCAEVMAERYDIIGYDVIPRDPKNFKMVSSIKEVVKDRDIIFIAVPTPHEPAYGGETPSCHLEPKDFDYSTVKNILSELNQYCTKDQLVVLISTVLPGTTRSQFIPLIQNYRFIYNPYLIAMGSVKWDMVNPEMLIIGTEDGNSTGDAKLLLDFYRPLMNNNPREIVGTWDEAESIKIFYNTFISAKIGLVNMIQDVAERVGHINVDVVTNALAKSTHRITGPAYMTAGLGDAGACHPRDNIALRWLADKLELGYDLFDSIMLAREVQAENLAKKLKRLKDTTGKKEIWIHGKAYKPNVPYTQGSYSLLIGYYLEQMGEQVNYVDPLTNDIHDEIEGVVLLAHHAPTTYSNSKIIGSDKQSLYAKIKPGSVIVDPWRKITQAEIPNCMIVHYGNTR